jgi:DNA-directed RNA polymerase specialized sigma24 family protein
MQTIPNSYLSAAQSAAHANAWQVFHKIGLTQEDREDVEQDILLALLEREGRYDESRSKPGTFAGVVSHHRAAELTQAIVRDRQHMTNKPHDEAANETDADWLEKLAVAEDVIPLWGEAGNYYDAIHTARDLDYAMAMMDDTQRGLFDLLAALQDMPAACKASGLSTATFYRRVEDLQLHLRMFGIKAAA